MRPSCRSTERARSLVEVRSAVFTSRACRPDPFHSRRRTAPWACATALRGSRKERFVTLVGLGAVCSSYPLEGELKSVVDLLRARKKVEEVVRPRPYLRSRLESPLACRRWSPPARAAGWDRQAMRHRVKPLRCEVEVAGTAHRAVVRVGFREARDVEQGRELSGASSYTSKYKSPLSSTIVTLSSARFKHGPATHIPSSFRNSAPWVPHSRYSRSRVRYCLEPPSIGTGSTALAAVPALGQAQRATHRRYGIRVEHS